MNNSNEITALFEQVNPQYAKFLLQYNTNNRPIAKNSVTQYMNEMKSGNFLVNGETIKFNKDGILIDGQNRLLAIAQMPEDYTYNALIVRGLPLDAFGTIDVGKARTGSDIFKLAGHYKYSAFIPAMIRKHYLIFVLEQNVSSVGQVVGVTRDKIYTHQKCLKIYEADKEIYDNIALVANTDAGRMILAPALTGAILLHLIRDKGIDRDIVYEFLNTISVGASLSPNSGILKFRNKLIGMRTGLRKLNENDIVKRFIKEFENWKVKETIINQQTPLIQERMRKYGN